MSQGSRRFVFATAYPTSPPSPPFPASFASLSPPAPPGPPPLPNRFDCDRVGFTSATFLTRFLLDFGREYIKPARVFLYRWAEISIQKKKNLAAGAGWDARRIYTVKNTLKSSVFVIRSLCPATRPPFHHSLWCWPVKSLPEINCLRFVESLFFCCCFCVYVSYFLVFFSVLRFY